jgi:hypothetical protein
LSACFVDSDVLDAFKILNPFTMLQRQIGLGNWDVIQLGTLLDFYGKERNIGCTIYPPLVDSTACRQEFFAFKLYEISEWAERSFKELWASITWSPSLNVKYPNFLTLADVARV